MPINNDNISDWNSFAALTEAVDPNGQRHISGLYFFFMTDYLIDIAHGLLVDLFRNPQISRDFGGTKNVTDFARFRYEYGHNANFLNKEQRDEIYTPLFGRNVGHASDGSCEFTQLRDALFKEAVDFSEFSSEKKNFALRERLRMAHGALREYLREFHGDFLKWACVNSLSKISQDYAFKVFRSKHIAAAYGINSAL